MNMLTIVWVKKASILSNKKGLTKPLFNVIIYSAGGVVMEITKKVVTGIG